MSLLGDLDRMDGATPVGGVLAALGLAPLPAPAFPIPNRHVGAKSETRRPAKVPAAAAEDDGMLPFAVVRAQLGQRAGPVSGADVNADRLPWPDTFLDHFDSADAAACRALWGEVLLASLIDVARAAADLPKVMHGRVSHRAPARWLDSHDFHMVASLAGLDGRAVADRVAPRLADPDSARALAVALSPGRGAWGKCLHD